MGGVRVQMRPDHSGRLAIIVIAASLAVAVANFFLFSRENSVVWDLHRASEGWINPNLTIFAAMTLVIIGGMVMTWGRHSLAELGLLRGWVARLLVSLAVGWAIIQATALASALAGGMEAALHPAWREPGAGMVIGLLVAMVLGTALFEDGLFRGYLLPQIHLALGERIAGETSRLIAALLICSAIFAVWHLPTILLNREVSPGAVAGALAYMMLGGMMLGLLYLRTGRLEIVIAVHALVNAPTLVVATPVPGSMLAGLMGVAAIMAGPLLSRERWSLRLIRIEAL